MKPYYQDDFATIYHGDCRDVLPELKGPLANLCIADPPYNVGKDYGGHDDRMGAQEYETWCRTWFWLLREHASKRVVVFPGLANIGMWYRFTKPSSVGCWHKPGNSASGHLGYDEWEPFFYWGQRVGGSSVVRATNESGAVWTDDGKGKHPCPKPVRLYKGLIQKFGARTILDPFLGSGTATLAAKQLGIQAIGIDIEERYCEVAAKRLIQEVFAI